MARQNVMLYCLIGALSAAAILGADVWTLRGILRTANQDLAKAHSSIAIIQNEAAMCRGMIGGPADTTWQVHISY